MIHDNTIVSRASVRAASSTDKSMCASLGRFETLRSLDSRPLRGARHPSVRAVIRRAAWPELIDTERPWPVKAEAA